MFFRIQDISDFSSFSRNSKEDYSTKKGEIDKKIAELIRYEVNGSKKRTILSYSKSLATCLLKYNEYTDNELHICLDPVNIIEYVSETGCEEKMDYILQDRVDYIEPLTNAEAHEDIKLTHFVIDISDNAAVDKFLQKQIGVHKKSCASPKKDDEVVILAPRHNFRIKYYVDSVYILFGLQIKYGFLCDSHLCENLVEEINSIKNTRFIDNPWEKVAFNYLVKYLAKHRMYQKNIGVANNDYINPKRQIINRQPSFYDPIRQLQDIMDLSFEDAYNNRTYNSNLLSDIFWDFCETWIKN